MLLSSVVIDLYRSPRCSDVEVLLVDEQVEVVEMFGPSLSGGRDEVACLVDVPGARVD